MPNDAKLGLVVGVGLVIGVAVVFAHKEPPAPTQATEGATAAVSAGESASTVARSQSRPTPAQPAGRSQAGNEPNPLEVVPGASATEVPSIP